MQTIPDKAVLQKVNQRLARLGGAQGRVSVTISRGDVTLAGTIQYEIQRTTIVKAASSVAGVRRLIDQIRIKPKEQRC